MNIIARRSGGQNVIGRPQARPHWNRPAAAPAARAQVWRRDADQAPATANLVGIFELGKDYAIDFNPVTDRNVMLGVNPLAADGTPSFSRPEDFIWATVLFARDTTAVAGLDEHVPTVTLAPTIAKADAADEWLVFTPAPDAFGATLTDGEIRVDKADDATVSEVWPVPVAPHTRIPQKAYASTIYYRWRNQSAEDAGAGRGWSAWSPGAAAAEVGAAVPPPPAGGAGGVLEGFTFDSADSRAGIERGVVIS